MFEEEGEIVPRVPPPSLREDGEIVLPSSSVGESEVVPPAPSFRDLLAVFASKYLDGFDVDSIGDERVDAARTVAAMERKFKDSACGVRLMHEGILRLELEVDRRRRDMADSNGSADRDPARRGKEPLSFVSFFGGPAVGKSVAFRFAALRSGAVLIHIQLRLSEACLHWTVVEQVIHGPCQCFPMLVDYFKSVLEDAFSFANVELFMLEAREMERDGRRKVATPVNRKLDFGQSEVGDQIPLVEDASLDEEEDAEEEDESPGLGYLRKFAELQPPSYVTGKSPQRIDGKVLSDAENPRYVEFCERIRTPLVNWGILEAARVEDYSLRRILQLAIFALFDCFWKSRERALSSPKVKWAAGQAYDLMSKLAGTCRSFCAEIFPDDVVMYCVDDGEKIIRNRPHKNGEVHFGDRDDYLVVGALNSLKGQSHKTVFCLGSTRGSSEVVSAGSDWNEVRGFPSIDITCSTVFSRKALSCMLQHSLLRALGDRRLLRLLVTSLAGPPVMLAAFAESCLKQVVVSCGRSSVLHVEEMLGQAVMAAQFSLFTWRPIGDVSEGLMEGRTVEDFKWILDLREATGSRDYTISEVVLLSERVASKVLHEARAIGEFRDVPAQEFTKERMGLCKKLGIEFENRPNGVRITCPHQGILHRARCAMCRIKMKETGTERWEECAWESVRHGWVQRWAAATGQASGSMTEFPVEGEGGAPRVYRASTARVSMRPIGEGGNRYVTFVVRNDAADEVEDREEVEQEGEGPTKRQHFSFRLLRDYVRAYRTQVDVPSTSKCVIADRTRYSILAQANETGVLVKILDRIFTRDFDDMGSDYDVLFKDLPTVEDHEFFVEAFRTLVRVMKFTRFALRRSWSSETTMLRDVRSRIVSWYANIIFPCPDLDSSLRCCRTFVQKVYDEAAGPISLDDLESVVFPRIPLPAAQLIIVEALIRALLAPKSLGELRTAFTSALMGLDMELDSAFFTALGVHSCLFDLGGLSSVTLDEIRDPSSGERPEFHLWEFEEFLCLYRLCPTCNPRPLHESQERLFGFFSEVPTPFRKARDRRSRANPFLVLSWRDDLLCPESFDLRQVETVDTGTFGRVVKYRLPSGSGDSSCCVALKLPNVLQRKNSLGELMKEVAITKRLTHPNIIKCFGWMFDPVGVGERPIREEVVRRKDRVFSHRFYIVYEWCSGGTLKEWVRRNRVYTTFDLSLFRVVLGIAQALAYCHRCRFAHLDVKWNNVVMFGEGLLAIPKLIDFGNAEDSNSTTRLSLRKTWRRPWYCNDDFEDVGSETSLRRPIVDLELIDVYGFGYILKKLRTEVSSPNPRSPNPARLEIDQLEEICMGVAASRPLFQEIVEKLQAALPRILGD